MIRDVHPGSWAWFFLSLQDPGSRRQNALYPGSESITMLSLGLDFWGLEMGLCSWCFCSACWSASGSDKLDPSYQFADDKPNCMEYLWVYLSTFSRFEPLLGSWDPDPHKSVNQDPHQSDEQDPDPHQRDADTLWFFCLTFKALCLSSCP